MAGFFSSEWKYVHWIIIIILIYILHRLLMLGIKRAASMAKIPPDVVNGLRVVLRFSIALLMLYASVIILDIGQGAALSLSVFLGSLVSFASMHTIQNFVSGLYLLISRPFKVNDFVKIGGSEGLVTDISLNYTSILNFERLIESIPNKKIIGSTIINYDKKMNPRPVGRLSWTERILDSFEDHEVTNYTFVWGAPLISLDEIKKRFDKICQQYKDIFGYTPTYQPYTINHRFEFTFILRSNDPDLILKHKTNFLDDISAQFH